MDVRESFWFSALVVLAGGTILFYLLASFVPFIAIYLVTNFVFIYVAMVYLLTYWEEKEEETTERKPAISVIVSAYNCAKTIGKCLENVLAMDYPKPLQVIVVEDASTDDTLARIKAFKKKAAARGKDFRLVINGKNQGKGRSINQALRFARGELVACIDADTYPERDALLKMVRHFTDGKVGAVIALVCVHKPSTMIQKIQEIEYYTAFGFWHTALGRLDSLLVTPGPMSIYSKRALADVGGFDADNITEDMEIALHLQDKGYRIKCTTDARIYTEVPATIGSLYKQRLRWLRGKIFNGGKYSHMLFNAKYGDFGRFVYPVSFLVEFLGVVFVARLIALNGANVANGVLGLLNVAAVDSSLLYNPGVFASMVVDSSIIFFALTMVVWGYIVWQSFKIANQPVRLSQLPFITVFMTVYSLFISLVYFSSMVHEAIGTKRTWGTR
ncbi:MAG: glycosyltransferase [Candidatus Micrarchaeota archaeon]|nr:glycosyltransferase [Candidatus Micrarchaeota archaeon]